MTNSDKKRFWACMKAMEECVGIPSSKEKAEIYFRALSDLDIADIEKASWYIVGHRTTASFPKPGEIREAISGCAEDIAICAISKIESAWRKGIGAYHNVCFDDPLIHVLIDRAGGWGKLCSVPEQDWKFMRKDLEKQYKAISGLHLSHMPDIPPVLFGTHGGHENIAMLEGIGRQVEIEYIGDRQAAVAWTQQLQMVNPDVRLLVDEVKTL